MAMRIVTQSCAIDLEQIDFMAWEDDCGCFPATTPLTDSQSFLQNVVDGYGPIQPELKILMKSGAWVEVKGLDALIVWWARLREDYYSTQSLEEEYFYHLPYDEEEQASANTTAPCEHCGHSSYETDCECSECNCLSPF